MNKADISFDDYYRQFIYKVKCRRKVATKSHIQYCKNRNSVHDYLTNYKDKIKEALEIDIDSYVGFVDKIYDETLHNKVINLLKGVKTDNPARVYCIQLNKYCQLLQEIDKLTKEIDICNKLSKMSRLEYMNYVNTYYARVHKTILDGQGYKFDNGIGILLINRWKINEGGRKTYVDYNESYKRKQELIKKGIKLYNKVEAEWYKARHIPYDGVKYTVFRNESYYYEFTIANSMLAKKATLEYVHPETIPPKFKKMTHKQIAETCRTYSDIWKLQVDIKVKLNILLIKDPTKASNYVRNRTEEKYSYRKNNSQD